MSHGKEASRRLHRLLGEPAMARLMDRLRQRLVRGQSLSGRLSLPNPSPEERDAIEGLLGRRPGRAGSLSVDLDHLANLLRAAGIAGTLVEAVQGLHGPVENRRAAREALRAGWAEVFAEAARTTPLPHGWLEELSRTGILKRLAGDRPEGGQRFLEDMARLAKALPVRAEPLAHLGARLFHDSHALDPGRPLGILGERLAEHLGRQEGAFADPDHRLRNEDTRRAVWAAVGVLCHELSAPVLVFNLQYAESNPLGRLLRQAKEAAEPIHLNLRLLLRYPIEEAPPLSRCLYVCENPTIVAMAAAELGSQCHPLICIHGEMATPARTLLRQLTRAGCHLRYHGDFDWPGLSIARRVIERFSAVPWRYSAKDYRSAPKGRALQGRQVDSPWDPALAESMARDGRAVHEEQVAADLLKDLRTRPAP